MPILNNLNIFISHLPKKKNQSRHRSPIHDIVKYFLFLSLLETQLMQKPVLKYKPSVDQIVIALFFICWEVRETRDS